MNRRRPRRWPLVAAGAVLTALWGGLVAAPPEGVAHLELRAYDALLRSLPPTPATGEVVIVEIDDRSLAALGRWPWPRRTVADLLDRLGGLGPRAVGIDVLFAEGEAPPGEAESEGDRALAAALARGPFVVAYQLLFDGTPGAGGAPPHPLAVAAVEAGAGSGRPGPLAADGVLGPRAPLARAAGASGFLNAAPDGDGILRRVPLILAYGGRWYPSLALATVLRAYGHPGVAARSGPGGLTSLRLGDAELPVDPWGSLPLRFRSPGDGFQRLSAEAVLAGRVDPGAVRGRLVLVGATATGLRESVATPVAPWMAGVEVHAHAVDSLLGGYAPRYPGSRLGTVLLVLGCGAGAVAIAVLARPGPAAACLAAVGVAGVLGARWLLGSAGVFVSPLLPVAALAANGAALALVQLYVGERRLGRQAHDLAVAQRLMLQSLASLAEARDTETGEHLLRTSRYVRSLCLSLAQEPRFRRVLDGDVIELAASLAPLHDIGKVGVPDCVLRKPDRLTPEELAQVQGHVGHGLAAIEKAEARAGVGGAVASDQLLRLAKEIVATHHERWDGEGYPKRLRGEEIPVLGRVMALVDVYDALTSRRVYKDPVAHGEAVREIAAASGTQFDPAVVQAFLRVEADWARGGEASQA